MTESLLVAHAGHWLMYVIYALPVAVVLAAVVKTLVAERREARHPGADS